LIPPIIADTGGLLRALARRGQDDFPEQRRKDADMTDQNQIINWAGVGNNELHSESETLEGGDFAAQISDSIIVHQNAVGL
jgi:hypothetical protein